MSDPACKFFLMFDADGVRFAYVVREDYTPAIARSEIYPGALPAPGTEAFPRHVRMLLPSSPAGLRALSKALEEMASHVEKTRSGEIPYASMTRELEWEGF